MDLKVEKELFSQFIAPNRKDKFIWNLENIKRRHKIFDDLRGTRHFDEDKCKEVDSPEDIINYIKLKTEAKSLYIISSNADYDGKVVDVDELENNEFWMTNEIIGYDMKSKIGFFMNHESWFYILG